MDYKDLEVWQKSHDLTLKVYKITNDFPKSEQYGLTSQIRRSVASVPTNIAEGKGSLYKNEYIRFLGISRASASEVEYQLILSKDLGYIDEQKYKELSKQIKSIIKMLNALIKSLRS